MRMAAVLLSVCFSMSTSSSQHCVFEHAAWRSSFCPENFFQCPTQISHSPGSLPQWLHRFYCGHFRSPYPFVYTQKHLINSPFDSHIILSTDLKEEIISYSYLVDSLLWQPEWDWATFDLDGLSQCCTNRHVEMKVCLEIIENSTSCYLKLPTSIYFTQKVLLFRDE
jgi:hypothetical protein